MDLMELAKQCPDVNVTIRLGDLLEANEHLVALARTELEQLITDAHTETYPSREKVAEILGVNVVTLNRWEIRNYLMPIRVGRSVRYRMSDVKKLLR